jgi:sugar (pentulose or hexulose) kinase
MMSLGIDIGTSGVRTAVLDGETLLSSATADHLPQTTNAIDANLWWYAVKACLHAQIAALDEQDIDSIRNCGIAVDGTSGSMMLTSILLVQR